MENKVFRGIHYSRFVASWTNMGGKTNWMFKAWLAQLTINDEPIPEEIVQDIYDYGTNGKMELEQNAKAFLNY